MHFYKKILFEIVFYVCFFGHLVGLASGTRVILEEQDRIVWWVIYAMSHSLVACFFFLLCVVLLCDEAKGRHPKTRQTVILAQFRVAAFRIFVIEALRYDMTISHQSITQSR